MVIPSLFVPMIVNAILLLCGYMSFKALETERNDDDRRWLTFWLVYSTLAMGKSMLDFVSIIIPFYDEAHILAIIYLAFFGGSRFAYVHLYPLLKQHEAMIDAKLREAKATAQGGLATAQGLAKQHLQ